MLKTNYALITQREIELEKLGKVDFLEQNYAKYYQKKGFILIPVSNVLEKPPRYFNLSPKILILSGGNDISPKFYNSKIPETSSVSLNRDLLEKKLINLSIKNNLPILAQCRGMQFLNVYFNGTLNPVNNHVKKIHKLEIVDDKFKEFLGKNYFEVNSYHNQGISELELSSELIVFAKSEEGLIEGVYHPKHPFLGIMWHPERPGNDDKLNELLLKAFREKNFFWNKQ